MDEIVVPIRRPPGGSPTLSSGGHSTHWDNACPVGTLQPAPSMRDVPKLSPLVAHRAHVEPLSGLIFTEESVLTICREGHLKIWARPEKAEVNPPTGTDAVLATSAPKEKPLTPSAIKAGGGGSSFKQPPAILTQD